MASGTHIELCGRFRLAVDGEAREGAVRGRQGVLLLAYLVLHRERPIGRDELVEAVWAGGSAVPPSDTGLAPLLSRLRRVIAPGTVEGRAQLVLVPHEPMRVDVEVARAGLVAARDALRRGDAAVAREGAREAADRLEPGLLPGFEADWLEPLRARLEDLRVEALETVAAAGLAAGPDGLPDAEAAARAAVVAVPFRESARAALIRVLRARGNVAEGLRVYEDARVLLREELGVTPGSELLALHEELLAGVPAPPAPPARAPAPAPAPARRPAAPATRLEERDRELDQLAALLDAAEAGDGCVALLEGPAGVGKSLLLGELRDRAAERGLQILEARAGILERDFPFGVVRQLFERAADDDTAFTGPARAARAVLMDDEATQAGFDLHVAVRGLWALTANLAEARPLLLAVDDLHWSDLPSLRFVAYLARRLEGRRVMVAATVRVGEESADDATLGEIAGEEAVSVIAPQALSPGAVARLVARRLGTEPDLGFAAACYTVTAGNPLLLSQLLTALAAERVQPDAARAAHVRAIGPRAVSRTVLRRLSRLPQDARSVARAVAVAGRRADLPVVSELAGLPEEGVAATVGTLARAEILWGEWPLSFVHPLVRDAVYEDLPPAERDVAHRRAARILDEGGAGADQVAGQLLASSPQRDPWAVERLRDAARRAVGRGAPEGAITYLRRALAEGPVEGDRAEVLLELGTAEAAIRADVCIEHLREAYESSTDAVQRGRAAEVLARTLLFVGGAEDGRRLAAAAAADLPTEAADLAAMLEAIQGMSFFFGGGGPEVLEPFAPLLHQPVGEGLGTAMRAAVAAWVGAMTGAAARDCLAQARGALAGDVLLRGDSGLFWIVAAMPFVLADDDEALAIWESGRAEAERGGSVFAIASETMWRGLTLTRRGDLAEAERLLRSALSQFEEWQIGQLTWSTGMLARALYERGEFEEAWAALRVADDADDSGDGARHWNAAHHDLRLAEGRAEEVLADVVGHEAQAGPVTNPGWVRFRAQRVRALVALGRSQEAVPLADEDLARARRWGTPNVVGAALRIAGLARGGDDGLALLREAVSLLRPTPAKIQRIEALAALGRALPEGPDRTATFAEALALARECGAARLARELSAP